MSDVFKQHLSLGRDLYARNDLAGAEPHLRAVLAERDDMADVHHMLGVIHHDRGELPAAKAQLERALSLNPDYTEAALSLSIVCNELGAYAQGRDVVGDISRRARTGNRIDPYVRGKLANLHAEVARAYEELRLWPEAIDEYRRALDVCPDYADLRTRLALCLRSNQDLDQARSELEIAVTINPRYVPARVALVSVLLSLGLRDDAGVAWREALGIEPANRPAQAFLRILAEKPGASPEPVAAVDADSGEFSIEVLTDELAKE